jgi:death-on-curing protein
MKSWKCTSSRSNDTADLLDFAMLVGSSRPWPRLKATFGGEFLHTSIPAMAAAYLFHLCQNHAFIDGNKRVGANAAIAFLLMNDPEPSFSQEELAEVVLAVASGELSKAQLTGIFESRCKPR